MGKFIMNGVPYGGGDVEANPSGTATDTLTKLGIEGTVYEIQGGGGGSSGSAYREVVLWNNPTSTASWSNPVTMTLNDDITNYHELKVVFSNQSGNTYGYITIPVSEVLAHNYTQYFSNDAIGGASNYVLVNAINEITGYPKDTGTTSYYVKVIGIKYGGNLSPIIYSEEEREVGVWTDNKPLYQKTYRNVAITNNADNIVDSSFTLDKSLITYKIDMTGLANTKGSICESISDTLYVNASGQLIYYLSKTGTWWSALDTVDITVFYTKTTDIAGSGEYNTLGIPNVHYDSNEKVIGTWFGETLYENSIDLGSSTTISPNGVQINIGSIDVKQPVNAFGIYDLVIAEAQTLPLLWYKYNGNMYFSSSTTAACNKLILQYTKSS